MMLQQKERQLRRQYDAADEALFMRRNRLAVVVITLVVILLRFLVVLWRALLRLFITRMLRLPAITVPVTVRAFHSHALVVVLLPP